MRADMSATKANEATVHAPEARVLVVDDAGVNLAVLVGLLKHTGIRIDTATGGAEAVKRAAANRYDLILMDRLMPEMDGAEALRRIRALEDGPGRRAPVICLTADADIGARERRMTEGFTDYLAKPVDHAALFAMLTRHLPPDKARFGKREEAAAGPGGPEEEAHAPLREAGIDTRTGLGYCGNDEALYRSMLSRYAREAKEKAPAMRRFLEARDWKNYAILVHALKSGSRMIGAAALGESAAALEKAANEGNGEAVEKGHAALMARYGETASAILAVLPPADEAAGDDGDILEFMPE